VQENQVGLKLNGTLQLLACTDDGKLLGDDIDTIKENTETLIDASKEVGLKINVEKTKCMLRSYYWNAGQNCDITVADRLWIAVQICCNPNNKLIFDSGRK
jgi:hypothetical protein